MRRQVGRKTLLVGVACGVALFGAAVASRENLAFHYHLWRLERAMTLEDARPCLAALERLCGDPLHAQRLVAMLGPRRPRLTFWALEWCGILGRDHDQILKSDHERIRDALAQLRRLLPFSRSLEDRLRRDEGFLAVMAHFIRWKTVSWPLLVALEPGRDSIKPLWEGSKPELLAYEPARQEFALRAVEALLLPEAWLLSMSPLPPPVELSFPLSDQDVDRLFRRWDDLVGWVRSRRDRLRFDAALGRFVEVPPGQGSPEVSVPAEPLPGWTGLVPRI